MQAMYVLGVVFVLSFCSCTMRIPASPRVNSHDVLERCDRLRLERDVGTILAGGTAVFAGAGGVTAIQFTDPSSQRHTAELSLGIGALAAIFAGVSSAASNAYTAEGCQSWFGKYRDPAENPKGVIEENGVLKIQ
jgi:hypothetical protein